MGLQVPDRQATAGQPTRHNGALQGAECAATLERRSKRKLKNIRDCMNNWTRSGRERPK